MCVCLKFWRTLNAILRRIIMPNPTMEHQECPWAWLNGAAEETLYCMPDVSPTVRKYGRNATPRTTSPGVLVACSMMELPGTRLSIATLPQEAPIQAICVTGTPTVT